MSRNEKGRPGGHPETAESSNTQETASTDARIAGADPGCTAPEVVVWECQCGRVHHYVGVDEGVLSALADACRPERVEVRR